MFTVGALVILQLSVDNVNDMNSSFEHAYDCRCIRLNAPDVVLQFIPACTWTIVLEKFER